jgi:hypothetical protein
MTLLEIVLIITNIICVSIYIFEKYLNRTLIKSYQKQIEALKERIVVMEKEIEYDNNAFQRIANKLRNIILTS